MHNPMTCVALVSLATLTLTLSRSDVASAEDRPNVVWIFVEDMNGWMGCYGDDTVPTPNIDRLAQRGVRFDRAYMPAGVCSATRSAIALGTMQTTLGVHNHRSSRKRTPGEVIRLPDYVKTAYELFREDGYFVLNSGGKNDFNFIWNADDLYDFDRSKKKSGGAIGFRGPIWRQRKPGQPFFAQIQLRGGKNSGRFAGHQIPKGRTTDTDPADVSVPPYYPDHPIYRQEIAHHYDCVRQTDDEVGEIIAALEEDQLLDKTVVFFWTDHGMKLPRHKQWLYEGGIRVPLIVAGPGIPTGRVREDLVSGIDITVTAMSLCGVKIPGFMEGRNFWAPDYQPRDYVVSARDRCDYTIDRVRAVTTHRFKYLRNYLTDRPFMQPQYRDSMAFMKVGRQLYRDGKLTPQQAVLWADYRAPEELYDLQQDPYEINNLATDPTYESVLQKHRELLAEWIEQTGDQGQQPESIDSLRGAWERWSGQANNPEFKPFASDLSPN